MGVGGFEGGFLFSVDTTKERDVGSKVGVSESGCESG